MLKVNDLDFPRKFILNNCMDSSPRNWGGKRKGAGRPKSTTVKLDGVRVSREVWDYFILAAAEMNTTPEALAVQVLESYAFSPLYRKM